MRLFHVSEDPNIQVFEPRLPTRKDLDPSIGLVWAIDEARLPNFLTPRDCPRVAYYATDRTVNTDKERFFSSSNSQHAIAIEKKWLNVMKSTTLYLYEFSSDDFILQDDNAGYYVAKTTQYPINKFILTDLFAELQKREVEVRIVDHLWETADAVKVSTLNWSLCRMGNASPRP